MAGGNITGALATWFSAPQDGDLHLTKPAGKGRPLVEIGDDFDGRKRGQAPDIGADEIPL